MMKGYINNAKENAQFFDGDDGFAHTGYGNTGRGDFKRGIQNQKDFCLRINVPKGNY